MLGLKLPTDPRWTTMVSESLEQILTDHAYCEQKAASTCISLIQLYPDKNYLVQKIAPVVSEEWQHFRLVLDLIVKRNLKLGFQRKDEYVAMLNSFAQRDGNRNGKLMDKLLMSALIEARSCERFSLLSQHLKDEELKIFYHKLMIAEAQHYTLFLEIAHHYFAKDLVRVRWQQWLDYEKNVIENLKLSGEKIH
jgi:tRNA-(ms[2]io[6]A)-hydroxylase